jgi:3-deoxy-alpha-D-manno-octulosonate 8-oxidase
MKNSTLVKKYILGEGSLSQLNSVIKPKRININSFVVFCIDHFFENNNLRENLPVEHNDMILFIDTTDEPKAEYIDKLVQRVKKFKSNLPCSIVGIGGGSTLDISKIISILLTNPGKAQNYQGWDLVKNKAVFKIGVPTIAGTGAEFTRTAVVTSKIKKLGVNSDQSVFDQVILDPTLLKTVPKDQFFFTAMDCFVHNVESLRGSQNDELTIAFAEKSLEMMRDVFFRKMNYEKLMVASVMGGISIANSNVGICHPLSYGLSLVLGLHHGFAICIAFNQLEEYYPEVIEFRDFLKKFDVELPKIINEQITQYQIEKIADATLKNEKPLENAFGKKWMDIFTKEKVISLIKKM